MNHISNPSRGEEFFIYSKTTGWTVKVNHPLSVIFRGRREAAALSWSQHHLASRLRMSWAILLPCLSAFLTWAGDNNCLPLCIVLPLAQETNVPVLWNSYVRSQMTHVLLSTPHCSESCASTAGMKPLSCLRIRVVLFLIHEVRQTQTQNCTSLLSSVYFTTPPAYRGMLTSY